MYCVLLLCVVICCCSLSLFVVAYCLLLSCVSVVVVVCVLRVSAVVGCGMFFVAVRCRFFFNADFVDVVCWFGLWFVVCC